MSPHGTVMIRTGRGDIPKCNGWQLSIISCLVQPRTPHTPQLAALMGSTQHHSSHSIISCAHLLIEFLPLQSLPKVCLGIAGGLTHVFLSEPSQSAMSPFSSSLMGGCGLVGTVSFRSVLALGLGHPPAPCFTEVVGKLPFHVP